MGYARRSVSLDPAARPTAPATVAPDAGTAAGPRLRRPLAALLYAAAWLPYLALYAWVFVASGMAAPAEAVFAALFNVAPPALLGLALLAACRRLPGPAAGRGRFLALHTGLAGGFAALSTAATAGLFALHQLLVTGGVERWRFDPRVVAWQFFIALLVYATLASFGFARRYVDRLRRQEARAANAEAARARAELAALRAQLNPHFLFNTLHTLLALVRHDADAAEEALERFADLLRYALRVQREDEDWVTLGEEWRFVTDYLALERLRLGDRLTVSRSPDEALAAVPVPAFVLQPLVENAVRHGIARHAGGGTVALAARRAGDELVLEVADDGPGCDVTAVTPGAPGLGLGLVRRRLAALYGDAARLEVDTGPGRGLTARVHLPAGDAGTGR